jgi:hypothetical protein
MFLKDWKSVSEIEEEFNTSGRAISVAEVIQERLDLEEDPSDVGRDHPAPGERFHEEPSYTLAQDYESLNGVEDQVFAWMIHRDVDSVPEMTRVYNDLYDLGTPVSRYEVRRRVQNTDGLVKTDEDRYRLEESVDDIAAPRTRAAIESIYRNQTR